MGSGLLGLGRGEIEPEWKEEGIEPVLAMAEKSLAKRGDHRPLPIVHIVYGRLSGPGEEAVWHDVRACWTSSTEKRAAPAAEARGGGIGSMEPSVML